MSAVLTTTQVLTAANALGALLSGVSAAVGLARPRLALPAGESPTRGTDDLVLAYAARAVPLALLTLIALAVADRGALVALLVVGGLAQVADARIGFTRRITGMTVTAGALAALHLLSAAWFAAH
ncbi:hypothetical protein GCM10009665_12180 [Kitasatospora nipponensis]|uniref:DUF4267 domain-containing protein n=1 Tax=Kitasatospora nipponensis TaxID=258049 RepID=A0ABN1VWE7_9ACTN